MRFAICCAASIVLTLLAGCCSNQNRVSNAERGTRSAENSQPRYRVELIPNTQLTPTSREGDKGPVVYSKNIAAVYVEEGSKVEGRGAEWERTTNASASESAQGAGFRVESIPNTPQLSPTSREGDKRPTVYSKNIIAVYGTNVVSTTNTVGGTNAAGR